MASMVWRAQPLEFHNVIESILFGIEEGEEGEEGGYIWVLLLFT